MATAATGEDVKIMDAEKKPGDDESSKKKKQAPFLQREMKIVDSSKVDQLQLLTNMNKIYSQRLRKWKVMTKRFKACNLMVTILVVFIQVLQVAVVQMKAIDPDTQKGITTILPVVTSAVLAIQLKLSWGEKSGKAKKSAALYSKLCKHVEYRKEMIAAGAEVEDVVKMWNHALLTEVTEVPAFLLVY